MQSNLSKTISYTIDWLNSWMVEIPVYLLCEAQEAGIKSWDAIKTAEQFDSRLTQLVKALYKSTIGAQSFVDSLAALIARQITLAFREAWAEEGTGGALPDYLDAALQEFVSNQYGFVDQFARDIVDAAISESPVDGMLARVPLWVNRYNEAYNQALLLISKENGGRMEWQLGATEEHCPTCSDLNGVVAYAAEWDASGVKPQNAPNKHLDCGGWRCDCSLVPTDKRRTKNAVEKIRSAVK